MFYTSPGPVGSDLYEVCPQVSGNLSGVGDGFPNTSQVLVENGYNFNRASVLSQINCEAKKAGSVLLIGVLTSAYLHPHLKVLPTDISDIKR